MIEEIKTDDDYIGKVINSKYAVEKFIGKGSMGRVYLCRNIKLENTWAVKIVDKNYEYAKYFRREAEILKKINHPNIPKIVDLLEDDENIYIVETFIEGTLLSDKIKNCGKLAEEEVLDYFIQLAELIEYLHNIKPYPIIYRDLKPNNIIITHNNRLVLVDFSISKLQNENSNEDTIIAGNKLYSSPEQLKFDEVSDRRSDIYSLGMLALRMRTGMMKNEISNELDDFYEVSPQLKEIIEKCTYKESELRYQEVSQLRRELISLKLKKEEARSKSKKIILVDGAVSSGKTFISSQLAKYYLENKVKTAIIDLTNEIGIAEYIDIDVDENINDCITSGSIDDIRRNSYKYRKYLEIYKGEVIDENELIMLIRKIIRFNDIVIIDNGMKHLEKLYDFVDDILLVVKQDEKNESLTNKKIVDYVDKKLELRNIKIVVNQYEKDFKTTDAILDEANIIPKIFKYDSNFKTIYEVSELDRKEFLKLTKRKCKGDLVNEKVQTEIMDLASTLYPLKFKNQIDDRNISLLNFADIKSKYNITKINLKRNLKKIIDLNMRKRCE